MIDRLSTDAPLGVGGPSSGPERGFRAFVVLVLLSVVVLTAYANEGDAGPIHMLRSAAQTVVSPLYWVGSQLERPFDRLSDVVRNATTDASTLAELEQENEELLQRLVEFNEYKLENARLEKLLQLTSAYGSSGIGARVIAPDASDWSDTVTVDKGSRDGVAVDMPVVDGSGVVGQVVSVSSSTSDVRLLTDPESKVSALLQNSRATGVLSGSLDGSLHLEYIPTSSSVSVGEFVVTSGLGGVYPKGLMLGIVSNVSGSMTSLYHDITVTPVGNFSNQEEVIVVMRSDATRAEGVAEYLLTTGELPDPDTELETRQAPADPAGDGTAPAADGQVGGGEGVGDDPSAAGL